MDLAQITMLVTTLCGSRAVGLAPAVQAAAEAWQVPVPILISQMVQESSCKPGATGAKGELGLMQLKRDTWALDGFEKHTDAQLRAPKLNLWLGARHLRRCLGKCTTDEPVTLVAWSGALTLYKGIAKKQGQCRLSKYAKRILSRISNGTTRTIFS